MANDFPQHEQAGLVRLNEVASLTRVGDDLCGSFSALPASVLPAVEHALFRESDARGIELTAAVAVGPAAAAVAVSDRLLILPAPLFSIRGPRSSSTSR